MKQLVFHIGADRYGLRLRSVVRVLPVLDLKQLPLAPDSVAGLLDFHGRPVPVIDLARMSGLAPSAPHFDTRIILVDYRVADARAPDGQAYLLGLLAERVLGVQDVDETALEASGVQAAPFLGAVASAAGGMVQLVEPDQLLPEALRALLFQHEASLP